MSGKSIEPDELQVNEQRTSTVACFQNLADPQN